MSKAKYVPARGDVVWLNLSPQSGHEQSGHRPALTISPIEFNRRGMGLFCPITNKVKGYPFEVPMPSGFSVTGVILADQLKSHDWVSRRAEFIAQVDDETVNNVVALILPLIDPLEVFGSSDPDGDTT